MAQQNRNLSSSKAAFVLILCVMAIARFCFDRAKMQSLENTTDVTFKMSPQVFIDHVSLDKNIPTSEMKPSGIRPQGQGAGSNKHAKVTKSQDLVNMTVETNVSLDMNNTKAKSKPLSLFDAPLGQDARSNRHVKVIKSQDPANMTFDTMFYIHTPKTGSSLFTLLRNRMYTCSLKDIPCIGGVGGGIPDHMSTDGRNHLPFDISKFNFTSRRDTFLKNTCDKMLNCKHPYFHCEFERCGKRRNKVTMFRNPYKWFSSYLDWQWVWQVSQGMNPPNLPFTSQTNFTTGENKYVKAIEILETKYIWWGITDYWNTSVCLFHCELGGEVQESEFQNTRKADELPMLSPKDVQTEHPRPDDLVPNRTAYVNENYALDLEVYSHLLPLFFRRAEKCGCPGK